MVLEDLYYIFVFTLDKDLIKEFKDMQLNNNYCSCNSLRLNHFLALALQMSSASRGSRARRCQSYSGNNQLSEW